MAGFKALIFRLCAVPVNRRKRAGFNISAEIYKSHYNKYAVELQSQTKVSPPPTVNVDNQVIDFYPFCWKKRDIFQH